MAWLEMSRLKVRKLPKDEEIKKYIETATAPDNFHPSFS